jgi:hypothetical protein
VCSSDLGRPSVIATARPGDFKGNGAVRGEEAGRAENGGGRAAVHANDLPAIEHPAAPNTGDTKLDKKYQQEQDKLYQKQEKDRANLQKEQDKEHQQAQNQHADEARNQQMEQRHQQQTEQMRQTHTQQTQQMQQRQSAPRSSGGKPK